MNAKSFVKLLGLVRATDDVLGEAVSEIGMYVVEQFHKHGNKTPQAQLRLAVQGGVDADGVLGAKGATLRGVSASVAALFQPFLSLGRRDAEADVESIVVEIVTRVMRTRDERKADAADARALRKAAAEKAEKDAQKAADAEVARRVKAATDGVEREVADEFKSSLVLPTGEKITLTADEVAALKTTLDALRAQAKVEVAIQADAAVAA